MAGGEKLGNVRDEVFRRLREAGLRRSKRVRTEQDVVFVPFGLVSSFIAYTAPLSAGRAAEAMVGAAGVEVCATVAEDGFRVLSGDGAALIRRRSEAGRTLWSYTPDGGDPLALGTVAEMLRARAPGGDGFFPDAWWFEATREAAMPDPLYRIARAFELVENPASVVCSCAPGHMYGAALTENSSRLSVGALRWTHGSLRRDDTLGFVMSDVPSWKPPAAARFTEALLPFVPVAQQVTATAN
jgi:hypothetical protein